MLAFFSSLNLFASGRQWSRNVTISFVQECLQVRCFHPPTSRSNSVNADASLRNSLFEVSCSVDTAVCAMVLVWICGRIVKSKVVSAWTSGTISLYTPRVIMAKFRSPSLIPRTPADNVTRVKQHDVSATFSLPSSDALDNCGTRRTDNNSSNFQNVDSGVIREKNPDAFRWEVCALGVMLETWHELMC